MSGIGYTLKPVRAKAFSEFPEGCTLERIENIFKGFGIIPSNGVARFYPFTYGFLADRELDGREIVTVEKSLKEAGYGEMVLRRGRV